METNEVDTGSAPIPVGSTDPVGGRTGLGKSAWWDGPRTGFQWASWVAVPIAGLMATLNLALTAFAAGSGRGWGISPYFPAAFGFFLAFEACGLLIGAIVGLIGRNRSKNRASSGLKASSRPLGPGASRSRGLRWLWSVGIPVQLILMIAYGAGIYVGRTVDRHLANAIKAADLDDPSWRIDDLMAAREPVPDAENSARVVAEALSHLPQFWPDPPLSPSGEPETTPKGVEEALERLDATADNVRLDDTLAGTLRDELETRGESVRLARTVAAFERGRHEVVLGPALIDTSLRQTHDARTVARLLAADAAIRTHDGDLDGALDSCRAILGVGRSIGDEPFLVSQLFRIKIGKMAIDSARRVLAQGEPSDPALARLQAPLLDELEWPFLLQGARGERAMTTEIIRRIGAGEMPIWALSGGISSRDSEAPREPMSPWGRLAFDHQRAVELDWMNKLVALARRPHPERTPLIKAWQAEVDRVEQGRFSGMTATIPLLFAPAISPTSAADFRYRCELGSMIILLGAERHRRETGHWPGSIDAIGPGRLPKTPVDPFTGRAFHMERRDGQILIYSIGPNGKDEHGLADRNGAYHSRPKKEGGPDDYGTSGWDVLLRRRPPDPEVDGPPQPSAFP